MTKDEFNNEEWLTPLEIARKFGYRTAAPIDNAISSGELEAHASPCGRRRLVRISDYARYRDGLRLRPTSRTPQASAAVTTAGEPIRRRSRMPVPK